MKTSSTCVVGPTLASYATQVSTTIGYKGVKTIWIFLFIVILLMVCYLLQKGQLQHDIQTSGIPLQGKVDMFRPTIGQLYQSAESAAVQ